MNYRILIYCVLERINRLAGAFRPAQTAKI